MKHCWLLVLVFPGALAAQDRSFLWTNRNVLGTESLLSAGLTFADVDGDGDLDAIVANGRHWPQPNEVHLNDGAGRFMTSYALGSRNTTTYAVPAGDLDGDGDIDVVVANDMVENWVYVNDGRGGFTPAWPVGPEVEPTRSALLYDMDGDGDLDVLITNRGASNGLFLNDGTGRFGPKREFGTSGGSTIAVAAGDVNGDGHPDLVLANRDGQANQILLNDGHLGFEESLPYGTGTDETRSAALADLNGDGFLDIVNANIGEPNRIYLGDGSGGFDSGTSLGSDEESYALALVDVDMDGDIDVVVANVRAANELYLNDGSGASWLASPIDDEAYTTYGVAAADLNGDGFPEIGFANSEGPNRFFRNVEARRESPARQAQRAQEYDPEARLAELGITLPEPPSPVANYVNGVRTGNLIFLAGKGPKASDGSELHGKLGADLSIEEGYAGARLTAINQLAVLKAMLGNLNRVVRVVKVLGMVNSDPSFVEQPAVINGFSDLIVAVFGERGRHARAAVGMASLPRGQAVEIEMIVEVRD